MKQEIIDIFLSNINYSRNNFPLEFKIFEDRFKIKIDRSKNLGKIYRTLSILNKHGNDTVLQKTDFFSDIFLWYRIFSNEDSKNKLLFETLSPAGLSEKYDIILSTFLKTLGIELIKTGETFLIHDLEHDSK